MGQQHRKETKRRRRCAYIKRRKEIAKNAIPVIPARKVTVAGSDSPAAEA